MRAVINSSPVDRAFGTNEIIQYAALPWRKSAKNGYRLLLVTSRERKRWILPKGWPLENGTPQRTAKREAMEEAGVFGAIGSEPCGTFDCLKITKEGRFPCHIVVYPLQVQATLVDWKEARERRRKWFSFDEAIAAVSDEGLAQLLGELSKAWLDGDAVANTSDKKTFVGQDH